MSLNDSLNADKDTAFLRNSQIIREEIQKREGAGGEDNLCKGAFYRKEREGEIGAEALQGAFQLVERRAMLGIPFF